MVTIENINQRARRLNMTAQGKQPGAAGSAKAQVSFGLPPAGTGMEVSVRAYPSIAGFGR